MEKTLPQEFRAPEESARKGAQEGRAPYEPPRIRKKRAVSRATLFTGSGPDSGGLVG